MTTPTQPTAREFAEQIFSFGPDTKEDLIEELDKWRSEIITTTRAAALEEAAEIIRQQDQIIDPRPTCSKLVRLILALKSTPQNTEKEET